MVVNLLLRLLQYVNTVQYYGSPQDSSPGCRVEEGGLASCSVSLMFGERVGEVW